MIKLRMVHRNANLEVLYCDTLENHYGRGTWTLNVVIQGDKNPFLFAENRGIFKIKIPVIFKIRIW